MQKKILLLIISMVFFVGLAWAGGTAETSSSGLEKLTILFWPGGPEADALQNVLDLYNSEQGIKDNVKVEVLSYSRQGFFDKLKSDLAAGSAEFDLNLITTYSLGSFAPYLEPIDAYITKQQTSIFIPSTLNSLVFDNKQYGIPTDVSLHFLFFRKDLIERLLSDKQWQASYRDISRRYMGTAMEPKEVSEWTWDDYVAQSLFFTKAINPDSPTQYGTVLQLKNLLFNIMIWQSTMVSNGGNWLDESGNLTINSPQARRGLEIYQKIIDNKATPAASINYEFAEAIEAFKSGQVAIMPQWNAAYTSLIDPEQSPQIFDKVGIAALPAGSEGNRTHVHSLGFGLNAASKHKAAAGRFLNWFSTLESLQLYAEGGTPPATSLLESRTDINASFPQIASSLEGGYVVRGGAADYALSVYTLQAEEFSAVWAGTQTISQALSNVEKRMKEIIQ